MASLQPATHNRELPGPQAQAFYIPSLIKKYGMAVASPSVGAKIPYKYKARIFGKGDEGDEAVTRDFKSIVTL